MLAPQSAITRAKSPEAFRTISEVSCELDVPQHVLRFWETRFAQVKPIKRAGGRRYYRPEDVDLLRGIRALLYSDGFTIKGVQKILRDRGLRHVAELGRSCAGVEVEDLTPRGIDTDDNFEPVELPAEPTHARAAIAAVERAHREMETLAEAKRVRLELLLAELLQLKARLVEVREGEAA
jgi:DNA-binding transcriptional MerR regulator